jgi:hypothetical protein
LYKKDRAVYDSLKAYLNDYSVIVESSKLIKKCGRREKKKVRVSTAIGSIISILHAKIR